MNESDLLIAILLYNDPGTLVELGMFKQTGKPTILFDPFNCCENMFVLHTPDYLCKNIADVIDAVYLWKEELTVWRFMMVYYWHLEGWIQLF